MTNGTSAIWKDHIREIPDFPKPGILFRDVLPIFANPQLREVLLFQLRAPFYEQDIDVVVAIEARGWLAGPTLADRMGAGFVPVRKPGKLPPPYDVREYELEYGTDSLCLPQEQVGGMNVLIHDDLLATGGTARACADLVWQAGGKVAGFSFIVELSGLAGREKLKDLAPIHSLVQYD